MDRTNPLTQLGKEVAGVSASKAERTVRLNDRPVSHASRPALTESHTACETRNPWGQAGGGRAPKRSCCALMLSIPCPVAGISVRPCAPQHRTAWRRLSGGCVHLARLPSGATK
eukprot:7253807-Pyramimonas_sp.AAC.1